MLSSWSNFINRSVSRKLALYIICLGLLVASSALVLRLVISYQQGVPILRAGAQKKVDLVLPLIQNALEKNDAGQLAAQMSRLASAPEIGALTITWRHTDGVLSTKTYPGSHVDFKNPYRIVPSLKLKDKGFGPKIELLEIDLSMDQVIDKLKDEGLKNAVIIFLEAVILAFTLIHFMEILFARHLRDMAHFSRRLDLQNLDESFSLSRNGRRLVSDELDELCLALNKMRKRLRDDVLERQMMELSLVLAKEDEISARRKHLAAEATNKAKSLFIATISHEIRTPMNGILGMVDLLGRTPLSEVQQHYLETIQYSGESLTRVISDVLDYSKMESENLKLNVESFNLEELVDECVSLFSEASAQSHVELYSSIHPATPRDLVGDPVRLRQIILILLGNAFKFTQKGFVQINVSLEGVDDQSTSRLRFSVEDTGIGICSDAQDDLFQPFNQVDGSITREYGGTGLGLAIANNLVHLMEGEMGVDSQEGRGSCFWFTASLDAETKACASEGGALAGKHVLLVSADEILSAGVLQSCQCFHVVCRAVSSGQKAIDALCGGSHGHHYDAVLIDSALPDIKNCRLVEELRAVDEEQGLVVFEPPKHYRSLLSKRERVLIKPITNLSLRRSLESLLIHAAPLQSPQQCPQFTNLEVLIAEDNAVNALVIEGMLSKLGIRYHTFENGKLAFEAYKADSRFELIFMDCEMPIMDGFAATAAIRQWEAVEDVGPVIIVAVTAHVETEHQKSGLSCGMDYYLGKPVSLSALVEVLTDLGFQPNDQRSFEN